VTKPLSTTVFLVEDHQMTLVGLKMLLEKEQGIKVVGEASDGTTATRMIIERKPDVVLMDIGLPEMDGIEATQVIKTALPNMKVIMLTSKDNEQDVFAALAAGADAYCMKGIPPETLATVIHSVRDGAAWLDPAIARVVLGKFRGVAPGFEPMMPAEKKPVDCPLTDREMEVLSLIVEGLSNPQIAERLFITKATAKAHVHSILQKLCVDDRTQAAVLAMRQGYIQQKT
jgi:DNA-binding NarL/FixJ family response regulator